jgi:hypothetical protein
MSFRLSKTGCRLSAALACVVLTVATVAEAATPVGASPDTTTSAVAAPQSPGSAESTSPRPAYQLAERSEAAQSASVAPQLVPAQGNEHPLMPALRWAYSGIGNIEKLQDYSTTLTKRERIGGKLLDYEYMFVKIRHKPFSVYMYFLAPAAMKGQEVIYIQGQNEGNMWAHGVGLQNTMFGTLKLKPDGPIAMRNERYPLTELGILNLTSRLVDVAKEDIKYGECEVKFYKGAKIKCGNGNSDRICTCIEVVHPVPRRNFLFHLARIFVDDELNLPIRYESYDWPKEPGAKVTADQLGEEYTYLNLKLNNGFTDADFDVKNPNYKFR